SWAPWSFNLLHWRIRHGDLLVKESFAPPCRTPPSTGSGQASKPSVRGEVSNHEQPNAKSKLPETAPRHLRDSQASSMENTPMKIVEVDHPLIRHKLGLMRCAAISTKHFRELSGEIASLLTYEATRDLDTEPCTVTGWDGPVSVRRIKGKKITIVPI